MGHCGFPSDSYSKSYYTWGIKAPVRAVLGFVLVLAREGPGFIGGVALSWGGECHSTVTKLEGMMVVA